MSGARLRAVAALGGLAVTVLAAAAAAGLYAHTRSTPVDLGGGPRAFNVALAAVAIAFAAVGAVIVLRRPGNAVGWLFSGLGLFLAIGTLGQEYAVFAVIGRSSPLPAGPMAAWFQQWSVLSCVTFGLGLLLLLFPDGHVMTRRWRLVTWGVALGFALFVAGYLIDPGPVEAPFSTVDNPFGIGRAQGVASVVTPIGFFLSIFSILAAALSVVLRFRRAGGIERQQIKWLASVAGAFALAFAVNIVTLDVTGISEAIATAFLIVALVGIPVAAGVAILRYRLYDIDVVINRTLVYGSVTALLAGTYVGLVLLLQLALRPVTQENGLAIALSTLAVAALFRPARNRIQALVDRRFYRRKYDAERTLAAFAARLREEVDLDALRAELAAVVAETMQPAHVSLWIHDGDLSVTPAVTVPRRSPSTKEAR